MTIKQQMKPTDYERLRSALQACFPDHSTDARITDDMVDGLVQEMWRHWQPDYQSKLGLPAPGPLAASAVSAGAFPSVVGYFLARARHSRVRKGAPFSEFVGELPVVRVRLAKTDRSTIATAIGIIDDDASLYFTVDEWNQRLIGVPGFQPAARLELITSPRVGIERFAAVACYLAYAGANDPTPSSYLLESGLAQGGPRMPFYAATIQTQIVAQTNYTPTAMSDPSHWYYGSIVLAGKDVLSSLHIEARTSQSRPAYMEVNVSYDPATPDQLVARDPAGIRAGALFRMAAIAQALGIPLGDPMANFVQSVIAPFAKTLMPWIRPPP